MSIENFIELFGYPEGKVYPNKVEYRGIADVDKVSNDARRLIEKHNLPFKVVISGSMAQMKAFMVESV